MQTTTRVLVRAGALYAGIALFSLASRWIEGEDGAAADIGGGFVLIGLLMVAPAVWAALDVRSGRSGRWPLVWGLTAVAVAVAVNLSIVVRQGMQPVGDLLVLGGFVGAVVAVPAILATLLAPPAPSAGRPAVRPVAR